MKYVTLQKMKFSIKDCSSKCDQIRSFLPIWSHLPEKSLMENFIFCAVCTKAQRRSSPVVHMYMLLGYPLPHVRCVRNFFC